MDFIKMHIYIYIYMKFLTKIIILKPKLFIVAHTIPMLRGQAEP